MVDLKIKTYDDLVRVVSSAGFNWDAGIHAWMRSKDGGGISDESLRDFCSYFAALIPYVAHAFVEGAACFSTQVMQTDEGMIVTLRFQDAKGQPFVVKTS